MPCQQTNYYSIVALWPPHLLKYHLALQQVPCPIRSCAKQQCWTSVFGQVQPPSMALQESHRTQGVVLA